jgi:hypothetical protein
VPPGEVLGAPLGAGADRHRPGAVDDREVLDHPLGDPARPHDSPADGTLAHDSDAIGPPKRSRLPSSSMCAPSRTCHGLFSGGRAGGWCESARRAHRSPGQTALVTVLIDTPVWPWRGRRWSHLVSDVSYDELHAFVAAELGIPRRAFQGDHYDVPEDLYDVAIEAGAQPVDARELLSRLRAAGLRRKKRHEPSTG